MGRELSNWLQSYLDFTALSESPQIFHFWTGVSTIAATLKRRVWIDMRHFEWTPNFYIIFVARAGVVTKSTTISIGTSLLREVDGVHMGPDSGTWQALGKALQEAQELIPLDNGSLVGSMEEMSCIHCAPGELGTFLDFKDYKLIDTLTSLWDGQRGSFEHRTAHSGNILINNPWINIISATTPAWLAKHVPEEAIGGGFASRVIFVFGEKKRHLVAYPGLMGDNEAHKRLREKLVHDLRDIGKMLGPMDLSPDALEWGAQWYQDHNTDRDINIASARFDGYHARKQTHIHKLAMVMSAAESSSGIITSDHLIKAHKIITGMESDMIRVFESIGVTPTSRNIKEIVMFLDTYKKQGLAVDHQTLIRYCYSIMTKQEFTEAMDSCIQANYVKSRQDGNVIYFALNISPEDIGRSKSQINAKTTKDAGAAEGGGET